MARQVLHKSTPLIKITTRKIVREKAIWGGKLAEVERFLFFLTLVLFPANLAKRLIFPSAYVRGVLIDYLVPTLYLTELLLLFLLALSLIRFLFFNSSGPFDFRKLLRDSRFWVLFPIFLLPSLFASKFNVVSLFRFGELLLWTGFSFWVSKNVTWGRDRRTVLYFLSLGVGWVSILGSAQFLTQRNILGYWFLGEPILRPSLGGVARTSFLGRAVLRAYGTFPHPNVLGGALAIVLPWLLAGGYLLPAGLGILALFFSFSRLAWICFLVGIVGMLLAQKAGTSRINLLIFSLPLLVVVGALLFPSSSDLSWTRRIELFQSAVAMFFSRPLTGIGLGLFTKVLPSFGIPSGPTLFLQPVHNIFALVAAESGIFALLAILVVSIWAFRKVCCAEQTLLVFSLIQLALLGSFDHYLYTLPQGLFLVSLVLGFAFSVSVEHGT